MANKTLKKITLIAAIAASAFSGLASANPEGYECARYDLLIPGFEESATMMFEAQGYTNVSVYDNKCVTVIYSYKLRYTNKAGKLVVVQVSYFPKGSNKASPMIRTLDPSEY